jgi:signal transduction histidine kinase
LKQRQPVLALLIAAVIVLGLLSVFAIELADTQAKSKQDVTTRVHERAVLASALIDSLFQTVGQQVPQYVRRYGTPTVSAATMERNRQQNAYLVLLDSTGRVIAHSRGFTPQAAANLTKSAALDLVNSGRPYGLGDVLPYGKTGVINFAVVFPTPSGKRTLVTGFMPAQLSGFLGGELQKIPGVKGAHNYLLDGHNTVLSSTNPRVPAGRVLDTPLQRRALARESGPVLGRYYDQVKLSNSTWRVVLAAPEGPLFASVSGVRKWVPWMIFTAFALVALLALALGRRTLRSADEIREANAKLAVLNAELGKTNAALERRAAELARSNSELEQFASIASHDLQEPLRKVRTFTEQVTSMDAAHLSDQGRDYLERANSAAARMQNLIDDLLKYSRVATHARPFAPVDLGVLTREVLEDLEAQVERVGADVRIGDLPTIAGDAPQLRQLMQNLLSNALKFHREGVAPQVAVEATTAGDVATITITDNGIGFEPQYGRRIFRVFERLHGRGEYPGTGIGLALCRKIAERHGGTIVADGEPGVGATFTVTLPIDRSEPVLSARLDGDSEEIALRDESHAHA